MPEAMPEATTPCVTSPAIQVHRSPTPRSAAAERGVGERCTWIAGDVTQGVVASGIASGIGTDGGFDLVTSHYLHEPPEVRAAAWLAETDLTAPGGVLLIVG